MAGDDTQQPLDIHGVRASFEAVQKNEPQTMTIEVIDDEVIVIGSAEHFSAQRHRVARPRQASPDGLCVTAADPPGGSESVGRWPFAVGRGARRTANSQRPTIMHVPTVSAMRLS